MMHSTTTCPWNNRDRSSFTLYTGEDYKDIDKLIRELEKIKSVMISGWRMDGAVFLII